MWAYQMSAPYTFGRVEVPDASCDALTAGAVLRVLAGGVCGSDLPYFKGAMTTDVVLGLAAPTPPAPGFPMHEVVGEVVETRHPNLRPGMRVVGWSAATDAIAEYTAVRGGDVAEYDPALDPGTAILLQPLACVIEAVDRLGDVSGASAAVIGQGPIGILFSHVLKTRGAARVAGVDRIDRGDIAAIFGVDEAVHASSDRWVAGLTPGDRPEVIVESVGHQAGTLNDAIRSAAPGARILYFGIPDEAQYPVALLAALRKRLTIHATVTYDKRGSLLRAANHLHEYPFLTEAYVTDRYPVDQVTAAFTRAITPVVGKLKVVLSMT